MAAPDLETLLDFETNIESAAETFLSTDTGLATSSIFVQLDESDLVLPRLSVMFELGEADDPPDERSSTSPVLAYRKYNGTLTVRVVTRASLDGSNSDHRSYRAKVRKSLLINATNFDTEVSTGVSVLPYYDVKYLRPSGTQFDIDGDLAISTLSYEVRFAIRNDAWPI